MSWTRLAATVSAAILVGWAATASAADEEHGRSGPYVGIGATYAFEQFSGSAKDVDDSWGYHAAGGFRFNEYFALELTGEGYVDFKINDQDADQADVFAAMVSGKVYPFHGIVQPYAAVGAGWAWVDDDRGLSTNDFAVRFAGGIDFYVARNWGLFVEAGYFLPVGGAEDYAAVPISFGVLYRFF